MQPSGFLPLSRTDIQFWNSRQSLEGLSVRSVFFGVFQSFVVLLYILDNETNFVVQVSVFIGVLIDLWKIDHQGHGCPGKASAMLFQGPRGLGGGRLAQPDPGAGPGGFPTPATLPGQGDFHTGGFFRSHEGRGTGSSGEGQGLELAGGGGSQHGS